MYTCALIVHTKYTHNTDTQSHNIHVHARTYLLLSSALRPLLVDEFNNAFTLLFTHLELLERCTDKSSKFAPVVIDIEVGADGFAYSENF